MLSIDNTAVQILALLWMVAFGGAIGSFLNVVVYRCPRGLSIVHPGSQCPQCGHAIRAWDNVPVLAWIWLRGRCRDCQAPISARYPIIELVVALLFASLGWVEVIQSGGGVAISSPTPGSPSEWSLAWRCGIWMFHLLLLCTVLVVGLIHFDGLSAPRGIWYSAISIGVVAPIVWLWLLPAAPRGGGSFLGAFDRTQHVIGAVVVTLVAWLVCWLVQRLRTSSGSTMASTFSSMFLTLGYALFFGARAGVAIVLASLLLCWGIGLATDRRIPQALISVAIGWGWLLAWPSLCGLFPALGPAATHSQSLLLAGFGAVGIGLLAPCSMQRTPPSVS